jgi:hypothetical protein
VVVAANAAVLAVTKIKKALVLKKAPAANNRSLDENKKAMDFMAFLLVFTESWMIENTLEA